MVVVVLLALLIVFVLAGYALHLRRKLQNLDAEREKAKLAFEQQLKEKTVERQKGIIILAKALVAEELSVTEACLRISWLLEQIDAKVRESEGFSVFFQVADATAHIPILEAWKALTREQRKAFDRERLEIEKAFGDFVLAAAKKLIDKDLSLPGKTSPELFYTA